MNAHNDTFSFNDVRVRKSRSKKTATKKLDPAKYPFRQVSICPFRVVIDTREQLPYDFNGIEGENGCVVVVPTIVQGLSEGDYSIAGLESEIRIERKTLDDLYGSVTWGRKREERKIARLNEISMFAAYVVEATWPEIVDPLAFRPDWINETNPRSVEGTIASWSMKYRNVHWWAAGDRVGGQARTFALLNMYWDKRSELIEKVSKGGGE